MDFDAGIHYKKRHIEKLSPGDIAYISWDGQSLCKVKFVEFEDTRGHPVVEIMEKIGHGIGEIGIQHHLFPDEVRAHPIDALINRVTW